MMHTASLPKLLRRTGYVMSCILVANPSAQLWAGQLQEPRLFHEPNQTVASDTQPTNANHSRTELNKPKQEKSRNGVQASVNKLPITAVSPGNYTETGATNTYQYNGFIATASGQRFLINGLPLSEIDTLVFVLAKHGGKLLVLKTRAGRIFELSIGQSISKGSL